jgi:hypothetical protein
MTDLERQRMVELDAAVGALVKDMRVVLGWVQTAMALLILVTLLQAWERFDQGAPFAGSLALACAALLARAWWEANRRQSKYGEGVA